MTVLIVGPSIGTSAATLWRPVADLLGDDVVVRAWELPGHGGRPAVDPAAGPLTIADLAADVARFGRSVLAEHGGAEHGGAGGQFCYAGDSLGGLIGLQLALDHPDDVAAVAICCSAAKIGTPEGWASRAADVRTLGTGSLREGSRERWFAPGFAEQNPGVVETLLDDLERTDDESYAACCDALAAADLRGRLEEVRVPILALGGAEDPVVPPADVLALAATPTGLATLVPGAGHQLPVEAPERVAHLLRRHVLQAPAARRQTRGEVYAAGMTVRREVLGTEHVDRATLGVDDVTAEFQTYITDTAWGSVWTRPGLTRRDRSLITITALIARGHHEELAMHFRAAVRNGVTQEEIVEVLLQSAIYCGVPDANTAFRIYREVLS